jgi:predicted DNA-binding ribbon-helix-helix protein
MRTTTLRARTTTRDRLVEIGRRRGLSMPDLLDELAERAEAQDLLAAANEQFAAERTDHDAEVEVWDGVAADGLDRR